MCPERALLLAPLAACGGSPSQDSGQDTGAPVEGEVELVLADADLLSFTLSYEVATAPLASGDGGRVDWSALSVDARGRSLAASDVDRLLLLRTANPDVETTLAALAAGSLAGSDLTLQLDCEPVDPSCLLSELVFEAGHPIDVASVFVPGTGPWLAWLGGPTGAEPLSLLQLVPTDGGPAQASFDDASCALDATLAATRPEPLAVPATGEVLVRWSGLTTSSQGVPLSPQRLDRLVLALVPDDLDGADLVLRHEELATAAWALDVGGRSSAALSELLPVDADGAAPADLTAEGQWLLALSCSTCAVPQPAALFTLSVH